MTRSRAADDFDTIRARMEELRRERAQANASAEDIGTAKVRPRSGSGSNAETERRYKDRREGRPPPWAPTIFVRARSA